MYSVLIIGLGNIGMLYDYKLDNKIYQTTHATAFSKHSKFNVIGGVDHSKKACDFFEKKFFIKTFQTVKHALKNLKPEVIVISVPTSHHKEIFLESITCNPKIILLKNQWEQIIKKF